MTLGKEERSLRQTEEADAYCHPGEDPELPVLSPAVEHVL